MPSAHEVVQEYVRVRRSADRPASLAFLHPQLEVRIPPSLPWGGTRRGLDGFRSLEQEIRAVLEVDRADGRLEVMAAGEHGLVRFEGTARGLATGMAFPYRNAEFYAVDAAGLITEIDIFYNDTATILAALGGRADQLAGAG